MESRSEVAPQERAEALCQAVINGEHDELNRLLDEGVDPCGQAVKQDCSVAMGELPLALAFKHNRKAMVQRLISSMTELSSPRVLHYFIALKCALNSSEVSNVYNKKENATFRGELRDWLAEGLRVGVYRLIGSGATKVILQSRMESIESLLSELKLLKGRGGIFGAGEKKTAAIAIEKLVQLLKFLIGFTDAGPGDVCHVQSFLYRAMNQFKFEAIETLLKIMVSYPAEVKADQIIYLQLINQLNQLFQWGPYSEYYTNRFQQTITKQQVELKKLLRKYLTSAFKEKVEGLINDKAQNLNILEQELNGLKEVQNRLILFKDHYGRQKKSAMIQLEQCIGDLEDEIKNRKKRLSPEAELLQAARDGKAVEVEALLQQGSRELVNCFGEKYHQTPLYFAIQKGHADVVAILMRYNPNMMFHSENPWANFEDCFSMLHWAALCGRAKVLEILLDQGGDKYIDNREGYDVTPLYLAAKHGHAEVVKLLIARGANINLPQINKDTIKPTPLGVAIRHSHLAVVQVIVPALVKKIDSLIPGLGSEDALPVVSYQGLINYLNREEGNYQGCFGLRSCLRRSLEVALTNQVNQLIESGNIAALQAAKAGIEQVMSDVKLIQGKGGFAKRAVKKGAMTRIEGLNIKLASEIQSLESETDADRFVRAAAKGDLDTVTRLEKEGVSIDSQDRVGRTALRRAAGFGKFEVVKYLIKQHADVNIACVDGHTALHAASEQGHLAIVSCLIEAKANVNSVDIDGSTPLHLASRHGHLAVAEVLIKAEALIDAQTKNGYTALHLAASQGKIQVVEYLIGKRAQLDIPNEASCTPLYLAVKKCEWDVVRLLVQSGANVNCATISSDWPTVFELASHKGRFDLFGLFKDTLINKIRSLIPGCPESNGLEAGDYSKLIAYLNGEEKHYSKCQYIRAVMRETLQVALEETVNLIVRDGNGKTKEAVKIGLVGMLKSLMIIQKGGVEFFDKSAMSTIKRLVNLLASKLDVSVTGDGLYSANVPNDKKEEKPDLKRALGHLNNL